MKKTGLFLFLVLILTSCLKEDELKKPFISYIPAQLDDGWQVSTPQNENIDAEKLALIYKDYHTDENTWQVRSLLVVRNGKLVAESYTKDDSDQYTPRAIWSVTKQVMGILTGIAIEQHLINDVSDSISDYLQETENYHDKKKITIEELLTMRSGIDYSNDGLKGQSDDILRQLPDKITDFILGRPLADVPGTHVQYKDCDPQLVSAIIQSRIDRTTAEWAKEVLFDKLEIKNLNWLNYKDGVTLGGFGIMTTPRELAKFGQCVLDKGKWKGEVVVNEKWIEEMTSEHVVDMYGFKFGYYWWIDESRGMVFMNGHGDQFVCVIPSKNMVIVMTAEVNTQGDFQFRPNVAFKYVDRIAEISY